MEEQKPDDEGHGNETSIQMPLPDAFLEFLESNGIDPSIYSSPLLHNLPRYIRFKAGCESEIGEVEKELGCKIEKVDWLQGFYTIPHNVKIASSNAYKQGKTYGIDAASGAAVLALDICPGDHVLDLCAAPGAKLCMAAELVKKYGTVTGVDISRHRLAACRTMLLKYGEGDRVCLFVADGTSFSIPPLLRLVDKPEINENISLKHAHPQHVDSGEHTSSQVTPTEIYGEWNARCPKKHKGSRRGRQLQNTKKAVSGLDPELIFYGRSSGVVGLKKTALYDHLTEDKASVAGYDKVLVDAECTHDGSIKHISKFEQWGWSTLEQRFLAVERINSLTHLQLQLLQNGFQLLRVGGTLVYSTCSLTTAQNEDIVEKFLAANCNAELQEIVAAKDWPCLKGGLQYSLRFDPLTSRTSGLFIARISKNKQLIEDS